MPYGDYFDIQKALLTQGFLFWEADSRSYGGEGRDPPPLLRQEMRKNLRPLYFSRKLCYNVPINVSEVPHENVPCDRSALRQSLEARL